MVQASGYCTLADDTASPDFGITIALPGDAALMHTPTAGYELGVARKTRSRSMLSNKGMKQTKPAQAMELRSLSPVFDGLAASATHGRRLRIDLASCKIRLRMTDHD